MLPPTSNDDFRTSVVMTELSARFSLLRERPTKNSPKASDRSNVRDDGALYNEKHSLTLPKKQCNCQNNDGGSQKRPTTSSGRIEGRRAVAKHGSGIMNRGRTTEGNNFFGGRQKVNIIPSSGSYGRALYCDDIGPSTFERWRQREKERNAAEGNEPDQASGEWIESSYLQDASPGSSIDYRGHGLQRELSRNKAPGPSRTRTLPTSIQTTGVDNSPERTVDKTIRTKASAPDLHSFLPLDPGTPPPMPTDISPIVRESKEIATSLPMPPLSAAVDELNSSSMGVGENREVVTLRVQSRSSVRYDEEEYVRRQRQLQGQQAIKPLISGPNTNRRQVNRRSSSSSGLNSVQLDRAPSTFQSKHTGEGELLPRTCFRPTEHVKKSPVEIPRLASRKRSGSAAAASPGTDSRLLEGPSPGHLTSDIERDSCI